MLFRSGNFGAQRSHKIRPSDLVGAPSFRSIAPQFAKALKGRVPVAHKASFDLPRINYELELLGRAHVKRMACTIEMGKWIGYGSMKLAVAIKTLKLNAVNSHQAEDDSIAASLVLRHYLKNDRDKAFEYLHANGFKV